MRCHFCRGELPYIHPDLPQHKTIDGFPVCLECWCDKLGDIIEEHPIGGYSPRRFK